MGEGEGDDGLVSRLVRGLGGVEGGWLECVIVSLASIRARMDVHVGRRC